MYAILVISLSSSEKKSLKEASEKVNFCVHLFNYIYSTFIYISLFQFIQFTQLRTSTFIQ